MGALMGPLFAVASRPFPGEVECGDQAASRLLPDGRLLIGVADGLGHGPLAAAAARSAVATAIDAAGAPLPEVFERCHQGGRSGRGSAMTLVRVSSGSVEWAGVGNVEAWVVRPLERPRIGLCVTAGVVGLRLPRVRPAEIGVQDGDLLVVTTDGVDPGFTVRFGLDPEGLARSILRHHARAADDALVLVCQLRGPG